jgi:hypothetical protein
MNRKGDSIPDRPHRRSELFDPPEQLEVVSIDLLRNVAAQAPAIISPHAKAQNGKAQSSTHEQGARAWHDQSGHVDSFSLPRGNGCGNWKFRTRYPGLGSSYSPVFPAPGGASDARGFRHPYSRGAAGGLHSLP